MNKQVEHFNQRDRRRLRSGLWPATSLRGVSGLLLIKMLRNKNFLAYRACWHVPFITPRLPGSRIVRECSAFSPPLSEMWIVWQKSPLIFKWNVLILFLGRESLRIRPHSRCHTTPFPSRAWGLQDTCQGGFGIETLYWHTPSPYTRMSYQE